MNPKLLEALSLGFDDPKSLKRFITATLGVGAVALHDKLGVSLTDIQIEAITGITMAYILGSNYLAAAKKKGVEAAAVIVDPAKADEVIKATPPSDKGAALPLALLVAFAVATLPMAAQAQVVDAPTIDRSSEMVPLKKSEAAPFDGRLYGEQLHVDVAKRIVKCETTLKEVEPKVGMPTWQAVLLGVGAAVVAASIAVPITLAVKTGPPQ